MKRLLLIPLIALVTGCSSIDGTKLDDATLCELYGYGAVSGHSNTQGVLSVLESRGIDPLDQPCYAYVDKGREAWVKEETDKAIAGNSTFSSWSMPDVDWRKFFMHFGAALEVAGKVMLEHSQAMAQQQQARHNAFVESLNRQNEIRQVVREELGHNNWKPIQLNNPYIMK